MFVFIDALIQMALCQVAYAIDFAEIVNLREVCDAHAWTLRDFDACTGAAFREWVGIYADFLSCVRS